MDQCIKLYNEYIAKKVLPDTVYKMPVYICLRNLGLNFCCLGALWVRVNIILHDSHLFVHPRTNVLCICFRSSRCAIWIPKRVIAFLPAPNVEIFATFTFGDWTALKGGLAPWSWHFRSIQAWGLLIHFYRRIKRLFSSSEYRAGQIKLPRNNLGQKL